MHSPEYFPNNTSQIVRKLLADERYGDLSTAILGLPNDERASRSVEELLGDVASKVRTRCPGALIASLKKLLELENPSRLSHATAFQMFVHHRGNDHRICELAIDVLSREDTLLRFREPYNLYENTLTEGERKIRDEQCCEALVKDIQQFFSAHGAEWPDKNVDRGLSELLAETYHFHAMRLSTRLSNYTQEELKPFYDDKGERIAAYAKIAFTYGYPRQELDDLRTEMLFSRQFQIIADSLDSIYMDSCPPFMTVPPSSWPPF